MKRSFILVLGLGAGALLSFGLFGLLWIGLPVYQQAIAGVGAFFLLCFVIARAVREFPVACALPLLGAAPLGGLITAFRDKEDSHAKFVLLVTGWIFAAVAGAWLGSRRGKTPR